MYAPLHKLTRVRSLAGIYVRGAEENKAAVLSLMLPARGGVFVDVGCADGSDSVKLRDQIGASTVIGLELADQFVGPARARGVDVRQVDLIEHWPLEDGSIDAVHSNQVIEHLAQTDHFMREIRRVLKPDGYAVVSTNNLASWHNVIALALGWQPLPCHVSDDAVVGNPLALPEACYDERVHRHLRIFTGKALRGLAQANGLFLDQEIGSGYYPLIGRAAGVMARIDRRHSAYLVHRYRVAQSAWRAHSNGLPAETSV
jgi:SAM-dependent methyltransferase